MISDHHPDFHGGDYENAITVVSGTCIVMIFLATSHVLSKNSIVSRVQCSLRNVTAICCMLHCVANSSDLRKRFDSLQAGVKQREQLLNQAVARRNEFDQSLAGLVDPLSELEARLAQSDRTEGTKLKDKMDNLQVRGH